MLRDPAFVWRPNNTASRGRGEGGKNRSATKFRKNAPQVCNFLNSFVQNCSWQMYWCAYDHYVRLMSPNGLWIDRTTALCIRWHCPNLINFDFSSRGERRIFGGWCRFYQTYVMSRSRDHKLVLVVRVFTSAYSRLRMVNSTSTLFTIIRVIVDH